MLAIIDFFVSEIMSGVFIHFFFNFQGFYHKYMPLLFLRWGGNSIMKVQSNLLSYSTPKDCSDEQKHRLNKI